MQPLQHSIDVRLLSNLPTYSLAGIFVLNAMREVSHQEMATAVVGAGVDPRVRCRHDSSVMGSFAKRTTLLFLSLHCTSSNFPPASLDVLCVVRRGISCF
nr:hypothetical protein CFP56_11849 [Quercus suber]